MNFSQSEIAIFKKRFYDADSKNTDVFGHSSVLFKICQDLLDLHKKNDNLTKERSFSKMRVDEPRMQSGADDLRVLFIQ